MTPPVFTSRFGRQLWQWLPEVYRTRDVEGHLALYLDACGELLDGIRALMERRLADSFPGGIDDARPSQDWVLPYFGDLLDVRLRSPYPRGRRRELERAVAWRQGKGTLAVVEEAGQAVAALDVELQEGFQRVAVTPNPGLPGAGVAVTPDFRRTTRAVQADPADPEVRFTRFRTTAPVWLPDELEAGGATAGETMLPWRHLAADGLSCFPGSYEDPSRRTADLRTPDWARGHAHPRRLLVHYAPPPGFFPRGRLQHTLEDALAGPRAGVTVKAGTLRRVLTPGLVVELTGGPGAQPAPSRIVELVLADPLALGEGAIVLERSALVGFTSGRADQAEPVIDARDSLIGGIDAAAGLVRLEHCTVLGPIVCARLQASDCILLGEVTIAGSAAGCVRYSRIPAALAAAPPSGLALVRNTTDSPVFFADAFGRWGSGVLHPATSWRILEGAEDGGEQGAFHRRAYSLALDALAQKLLELMPLGIEAVLIPDARLSCRPPVLTTDGG